MSNSKIKYCVLLLVGITFLSCSNRKKSSVPENIITKESKNTVKSELENTIYTVVKAFKEKNKAALDTLVLKEKGVITLFRPGAIDEYQKTDAVDFQNPVPEYMLDSNFSSDINLSFESLPTFDHGAMKWSKTGLFCDTTLTNDLLSKTAKNLNKYMEYKIPEQEIQSFKKLEKDSHRVVLCNNHGGELIFYLTLINNNWYLTIVDRVTTAIDA